MSKYLGEWGGTEKKILMLYSTESPISVLRQGFDAQKSTDIFFHWIISFYKTSFFHIPFGYYGQAVKPSEIDLKVMNAFSQRKNAALVIINDCDITHNFILEYIKELKKYFAVDTFGKCFNKELNNIMRIKKLLEYKCYLSIENSQCQQFITEKYWDTVQYGTIPIVMGYSKNISDLISDSFINVFDFPNPKSLAIYLEYLSKHETEYSRYHQWRKLYSAHNYKIDSCELLSAITNALNNPITEDPTLHVLGDQSRCLSIENMKNQLLKT
ncbi:hypothetical protein HZS_2022 [Henneguya salminicola]|nr:hypothetical protein HZS_2022 [Henneguya salminicola]